jgi:alpha-L-rhamnosidase
MRKVSLICLFLAVAIAQNGPLPPTHLLTEYVPSPLRGLDVPLPRFSWSCQHPDRAQNQSAYQIVLSLEKNGSRIVWDSGKVISKQNTQVEYSSSAPALQSDTTYFWKVKWWDFRGQGSDFSNVFQIDTGLFNANDWKASWIGGANQLRKEFSLQGNSGVKRARLFIVGLGYYEVRINGAKIGNKVLGAFTTFEKRVLYDIYDVTSNLNVDNAIAVSLGNGWYAQPSVNVGPISLLLQLSIELFSGQKILVVSDFSWKIIQGPVIANDIYQGETYDARLETPGWDFPYFDDSTWKAATAVPVPTGVLSAQFNPGIEKVDTYTPISINEPQPGIFVLDFGQNMAGWCRLKVEGPRGVKITLTHSEMISEDGMTIDMYGPGNPMKDTYILKGDGIEYYEPKFTYHGFQYVQITGFPGVPDIDTLQAFFVHTALDETGSIVFQSPVLNQIQHATRFASLSNWYSIPTDCPQRERRGWLGDAQLSAETCIHNWDMAAIYTKFMRDIQDSQQQINAGGQVPDCVPFYGHGQTKADPAWGTAYTFIWHWLYQYYGDTRILKQYYSGVKKYIDSLLSMADPNSGTISYSSYGDWCAVSTGFDSGCAYPSTMTSSFYLLLELETFSKVAALLNNTADSVTYKNYALKLRQNWNAAFYHANNSTYDLGYQNSQALALFSNTVDPQNRDAVINELLNDIVTVNSNHMTAGIVGSKYVMLTLSQIGRTDVAYAIATQTTFPSWGYMVEQGATTLWEDWQSSRYTFEGSKNHIMFGSQSAWYYQVLGGITNDGDSIGWEKIRFAPSVQSVQENHVSASINTHKGQILSSWQKQPGLCGEAEESKTLTITCSSGTITKIDFASYGLPSGNCGNFTYNQNCHDPLSIKIVGQYCLGKTSCSIPVNNNVFQQDPCYGYSKKLEVQVSGCAFPIYTHSVAVPVTSSGIVVIPKLGNGDNSILQEGKVTVWKNGAYIPGVPGIFGINNYPDSLEVSIGSGNYLFGLIGAQENQILCNSVKEGEDLKLFCPDGKTISSIQHASFGSNSKGTCGNFKLGKCSAGSSVAVLERNCLFKNSCRVKAVEEVFSSTSICSDEAGNRFLTAEFMCS